jgi:hypothetical protein
VHFLIISIALQLLCIVHVFRTGRNTAWIMAIAFLPLVGILAYFIVEILPGLPRDRRVREARTKIADRVDPERHIREARDAAEFSDTAGHRLEYGDALMARERFDEALREFRAAERLSPHVDRAIGMRIAEAAYGAGRYGEGLAAIERLPETISRTELDRRALLRAKIAEADGRADEALAIYRDIVGRVPGDEVRCRMAALLIAAGDRAGAKALLKEVVQRMKRTPPVTLKAEVAMYDWVKRTLAELG